MSYKYLIKDKNTGYRFITSHKEIIEDFPNEIKARLGLEDLTVSELDTKIKVIDKFNNQDLKSLVHLPQHRAVVNQFYLENIKSQVLLKTQMPWIEYQNNKVKIVNYHYGIYLNEKNTLEVFIDSCFKRLKEELGDSYLVLRKEPQLNWGFDANNVCTWSLSFRAGILPSLKLK